MQFSLLDYYCLTKDGSIQFNFAARGGSNWEFPPSHKLLLLRQVLTLIQQSSLWQLDDKGQDHWQLSHSEHRFIGLNDYHIHILYTGWVSCKPGNFLVFSNDFVCPRSPQPQKQGWGQNQGGWNRKDDEPELDEEAVTLGWCKLARILCFTFNCF